MTVEKYKVRRFECTTNINYKFWSIQKVKNDSQFGYKTTWGRIGNKGTSRSKYFSDLWSRNSGYDSIIQSKLKKGYVEVFTLDQELKTEAAPKKPLEMPEVGKKKEESTDDSLMDRLDFLDL